MPTEVTDNAQAAYGGDPQPIYAHLRKSGGGVKTPGGVIAATRSDVEEVFREYDRFSADHGYGRMGNTRPLIPMEFDPPIHRKYRKILEPLFSPQRVAVLEPEVAALCNHLIDGFIDDPEIDFVAQFSNVLPTQVFLTQLGLPIVELEHFLKLKDGAIRANHILDVSYTDPAAATYRYNNGQEIYAVFNAALDEREIERKDDLLSYFSNT